MQKIMVDGIDFRELLAFMNKPLEIDEKAYQEWREQRKAYKPRLRSGIYLRGSDLQSYMKCARRLWYLCHQPKIKKSMITKGIYGCEIRHELIEEKLEEQGWETEFYCKGDVEIGKYLVKGTGHVDGLSPSNIILDIKNKYKPTDGDKLQTGFYQKLLRPTTTNILLLYPTQLQYFMNLDKLVNRYLPRVYACVALDIIPPLHPSYPNCYYNCEYYKECGRTCKPPKKKPHLEWNKWFRETGALI